MTPLEITFNVLGLIATFTAGAWAGSSKCHVSVEVDTAENRKYTWLDRVFPCWTRSHGRKKTSGGSDFSGISARSANSAPY